MKMDLKFGAWEYAKVCIALITIGLGIKYLPPEQIKNLGEAILKIASIIMVGGIPLWITFYILEEVTKLWEKKEKMKKKLKANAKHAEK